MPEPSSSRRSPRSAWLPQVLLAGALYFLIGRLFPNPGENARAWRLGAWASSFVIFAAHIGYERFLLRSGPPALAVHTAAAVALGGLGLAIAGMIHSLSIEPALNPNWLLALVVWPAVTGIPAFIAALAAGKVLEMLGAGRSKGS